MNPTHPSAQAGERPGSDARPVRVVLVGRTGLDAALRLDRGVELVRARTPVSAIGELADPIDTESPEAATVVVGPDAVSPDRAGAFVDALRLIEPRTRVLAVGHTAPEAYDGAIAPDVSPETVRRLVRFGPDEPAPGTAEESSGADDAALVDALLNGAAHEPEPPTPPTPAATPSPSPAPQVARDEPPAEPLSPAAAMALGGDGVEAAMAGVRARLACPEARFVPGSLPEAQAGAPFEFQGRRLGTLAAPGVPQELLRREAAALAPWAMLAVQHEQLRRAAFTDDLTGAWNRRYFNGFLGAAIKHARDHRHTVTLLVFDVDDFKKYNDRYGHAAGDEILVETVKLLQSVIRPTDRVCRIGGDEFAVVFHDPEGPRDPGAPGKGPQTIGAIAERFQQQICLHRFPKLGDEALDTLTISGGMASFPWDGASVQELLDRADQLALRSKRQGKNAITFGPGAERACRHT